MEREPMQLDIAVVMKKYQDRVMQLISTNIMLEAQLEAVMAELDEAKKDDAPVAVPANGAGTLDPSLIDSAPAA